ncbi:O-antigen ligase family protein [Lacicoccus alkaliphilus]|uniref:O-antigen ligase like membrane protein n=1 Tax=Lacicoccus alkaliphilus DSM 16010 TaxID=1123231 RepID=A0A1M7FWN3_9BACL|nr:O-antigen ligase family protein [Salinicoccus alkaliphilus]SHM08461.1 O-antigen ligase like membrane protein [Salinicoccus alkaliphilus DSM 16010]
MFEKNFTTILILTLSLIFSLVVPNSQYLLMVLPLFLFIIKFNLKLGLFYSLLYLIISGNGRILLETFGIPFAQVILAIIYFIYILLFMKKALNKNNLIFVIILFLFFFIYLIFGGIKGDYQSVLNLTSYFLSILIFVIGLTLVINKSTFNGMIEVTIISIISMCLITFNQWLFLDIPVGEVNNFHRASGVFGNPNILAQNLLLLTPAVFKELKNYKFFSISVLLLTFTTIILTQSRGSLLIFLGIILLFVLLSKGFNIYTKILSFISVVILSIIIFVNFDENYFERFGIGSNSRIEALYVGMENFVDSFFGVGIGNTANNYLGLSSHNNFIHILSEVGVTGLILLILIMVYIIYAWIISFKKRRNFTFFFLPIIVGVSFFTHNLLTNYLIYFGFALSYFELKMGQDINETR